MRKTFFTIFAVLFIASGVYSQAKPGSRFFQTTSVRMCEKEIPGTPRNCKDFENNTIWQITNDLNYVKMIVDENESTMYIGSVDHEEGSHRFYFFCRDLETNMIYDFLIDFETKTVFLIDRSDDSNFIFYWSKQWEDPNAY